MKSLKPLFCPVLVALLFGACVNEGMDADADGLEADAQRWQLVQMGGSEGSLMQGTEMEWQETYVFHPDGTFVKTRTTAAGTLEATGVFQAVEYDNDDRDYLELSFTTGDALAGGCGGAGQETLIYLGSERLASTWQACDGPGLEYVLVRD
ncbi:hypothetical protein [Maribacter sp. 2307ULW6-5]|uniref:hypothetical protein n=1 Tax=Maribacter sp. 2307ULW6-5 TaxID=3386275 RepID=UPI0039BC3D9D